MNLCTWLSMLALPTILAQGDFAILDPEVAAIAEDPDFDPYDNKPHGVGPDATNAPKARTVERFDFDPSEGLTFYVAGDSSECFYQDAKFEGDDITGAYVVSSVYSHIDFVVNNPEGVTIYRQTGDAEGQYFISPKQSGVHALCFRNVDADGQLVTHVTNTLQSQHPVQKAHVSALAKYISHLDVRLGELESELRLQLIRADRHIRVEEDMNQRMTVYGVLECAVYLVVCLFQVYYIKKLLDRPRKAQSWV